jgi:aminoglycoside 6'-N-acetyltransferase I
MPARRATPADVLAVEAMMEALWPVEGAYDFTTDAEAVFVWEGDGGALGGFASIHIRRWADACETENVPYLEGWWVAPGLRGTGVGRALVSAVVAWCQGEGHVELGSDTTLENEASIAAHFALGFEDAGRQQLFRMRIPPRD